MMSTSNRRAEPRIPYKTALAIDADGRDERAGMTRNVSRRGLIFHSASAYGPGETLVLKLQPPDSNELREVKARVVRTQVEPPEIGTLLKHITAVQLEEPLAS